MDVYIATKRVRFDIDEIIGVFSDRDKAEDAIAKYILNIKSLRDAPLEEVFFTLAASWEVDVWVVDGVLPCKKENYGMTEHLIKELVDKMEAA